MLNPHPYPRIKTFTGDITHSQSKRVLITRDRKCAVTPVFVFIHPCAFLGIPGTHAPPVRTSCSHPFSPIRAKRTLVQHEKFLSCRFILDHRVKSTRFGQECEEFLVRMLHQCSFRTNGDWLRLVRTSHAHLLQPSIHSCEKNIGAACTPETLRILNQNACF